MDNFFNIVINMTEKMNCCLETKIIISLTTETYLYRNRK